MFELHYDAVCLSASPNSETCFRVDIIWNGVPLGFNACSNTSLSDGTGCSYTDFKSLMAGIWYNGYSTDNLDVACNQEINPFGTSLT